MFFCTGGKLMKIINITKENLEKEHICCAISNNRDSQVIAKKSWLAERFEDGLVFKKCDVRGKCFIEYIPAEKAWCPIEAKGYMHINCFWVSGHFKGQGYSSMLLNECIKDSEEKGKIGICALSSKKKMPFLSDPDYLRYKGFSTADTAEPFFELLYLPFVKGVPVPRFRQEAKTPAISDRGFVLYYSHQCPYTAKYVPILEETARIKSVPFKAIRFKTTEEAQNSPAPPTSFCLFHNGKFLTNEILSDKKFEKIISEI